MADKNVDWPKTIEIDGYTLLLTCPACPEQYDVFKPDGKTQYGQKVGYLRLRHGFFRADAPSCGSDTVYESQTKGDGMFDDDERIPELTKAIAAIKKWWEDLDSRES